MKDPATKPEARLFAAALDCPDRAAQQALLDRECAGQPELRRRVEALLAADAASGTGEVVAQLAPGSAFAWGEVLAPAAPAPGTEEFEGRYRLLATVGEGGFGSVHRAEQLRPVRREVALKLIKPGMDSRKVIGRFELERQTLAMMDHPNIARVLDAGTTSSGRPFFVMEFVAGERITTHADARTLRLPERLRLLIQVCHAIQHAHQKGVIHRDIKPSNVLVAEHDGAMVPKVIDFGIAKAVAGTSDTDFSLELTETHQFIGTPAYMSPEQAGGSQSDIDTRSDIYSLGVLLHELLTGRPPFEAGTSGSRNPEEMRRQIREREAVAPSTRLRALPATELGSIARARGLAPEALVNTLRGDLDWIVLKCLEKDRNRRYETANGLAMDLQRYLASEPIVARPPSTVYKIGKFARRNRLAFVAGTAVSLALLVGIAVSTSQAIRARRAESEQARLLIQAREAQTKAEQASAEARRQAANSERLLYIANLNLAQQHFESGDRRRLAETLRLTYAHPHRGFEWSFLAHVANLDTRTLRALQPETRSTAVSPDGRWGAFGSAGGGVELCDLTGTNHINLRPSGRSAVLTLAFTPDSQHLLSLEEGLRSTLWDLASQAALWEFHSTNSARCAAFTANGQSLVLGGEHGTVEVWDLNARRQVRHFTGHNDWVFGIAFSPDGRQIATGSWDKTIRLWDTQSWQLQHTLNGLQAGVLSVQFSPDGQELLSAGFQGEIRTWSLNPARPTPAWVGPKDLVRSLVYLPGGDGVATGGADRTIRIWDRAKQTTVQTLAGHASEIDTLRPLRDYPGRLISGSHDGTIKLWNLANATEIPQFASLVNNSGFADWTTYLAVAPDGQSVVHGRQQDPAEVWDLGSQQRRQRFLGHELNFISSAAFSPDSRRVVTGGHDTVARIWDPASGKELAVLEGHTHFVSSVAWARQSPWIVTGSLDGTAAVWQADSGQRTAVLRGHTRAVRSVAISASGQWIVTGSEDGTVRLWDRLTGEAVHQFVAPNVWVPAVAISPDETRVVAGQTDGAFRVWDRATRRELLHIQTPFGRIWEVRFSPDGSRFLTVGRERTAQLRDTETGREVLVLSGGTASIQHAEFTGAGERIVASCNDRSVRLWRGISPERLQAWLQSP